VRENKTKNETGSGFQWRNCVNTDKLSHLIKEGTYLFR